MLVVLAVGPNIISKPFTLMLVIAVLVPLAKVIVEVEEGLRKLVNDPARTALQAPTAGEAASAAREVLHQRMGAGNM